MYHHHFSLVDTIANAAVRGIVYEGEHRLFHGMSNLEMGVIAAVVVGVIWAIMRRPSRRRY